MVQFLVNENILSSAQDALKLLESSDKDTLLQSTLQDLKLDETVDHETLKQMVQILEKQDKSLNLLQLLKGAKLYTPKPPGRVRSPELEAIMSKIKRDLDEKEYQRMVRGIGGVASDSKYATDFQDIVRESKATGRWVAAIVNVLFSLFGMGVTGYYLGGQLSSDVGMRFLIGFMFAIITLIAEAWFFYFYVFEPEVNKEGRPKPKPKRARMIPKQKPTQQIEFEAEY